MKRKDITFYERLTEEFIAWAQQAADIEVAYIIGSRAREDHFADEWSDMDIFMVASEPRRYLDDAGWLSRFGNILCSFTMDTVGGTEERLVLFEGGHQADFVVLPAASMDELVKANKKLEIFSRGAKVLVDKKDISKYILPQEFHAPAAFPLTQQNFLYTCNTFWFSVYYVARQILRNELWVAKARDADVKAILLQMIEWYEKAANGAGYDTWHAGRFIGEWASADVMESVARCFGRFDIADSFCALMETVALFKRLSHSLAQINGYAASEAQAFVEQWLTVYQP
ncbi:aminoglycoside 6-adenylyltransferase [Clostridia bacterium OttesenSCG-928-F22]|nr:aminoglycoside 6-adenylyltransferase [Clostridia bacterium OttesenSCG-928-F22]